MRRSFLSSPVVTVPFVFSSTSVCALSTPDEKRWAAARVFIIGQLEKWNGSKMSGASRMGNIMPNDSHQRTAEFHELAAHAHRVAATHHSKEDHQTGHEHSKQALEYAHKAFEWSQEAHRKSVKSAGKP
jgi:hypothetical protein